jgi:hypothetical protein
LPNLRKERNDDLVARPSACYKVQPDRQKKTIPQFAINHSSHRGKDHRVHQMHQDTEQNQDQVILGCGFFKPINPAKRGVIVYYIEN